MRTNHAVGSRILHGSTYGTILEALPLADSYRIMLDNGREIRMDERMVRLAHDAAPRLLDKAVRGPRDPRP